MLNDLLGVTLTHKDILARWVIEQGLSTGHGDTFCSILDELKFQINEIRLENSKLKEKLYETQSEVVLLRNKTPNIKAHRLPKAVRVERSVRGTTWVRRFGLESYQ